jgi:DNA-binding PadR family transcriptional regulator
VFAALLEHPSEWQYGYDLAKRTGLPSGTLYPILIRLAGQGLLEENWTASDVPGRPPRHSYRLSAAGTAAARDILREAGVANRRLRPSRAT